VGALSVALYATDETGVVEVQVEMYAGARCSSTTPDTQQTTTANSQISRLIWPTSRRFAMSEAEFSR